MATGTTAEGTIWTTRPMSPEIEAGYTCEHRGGVLICAHAMDERAGKIVEGRHVCLDAGCHCDGKGHEVNRRCGDLISSKGKPYSPATPKGSIGSGLPASVGIGLLDVYATARRRLAGLEPWPVHVDTAPRLSKIAGAGDPKIRRAYREFIEAIVKNGGVPSYQFVAKARKQIAHPARGQRVKHPKRQHGGVRDHGAAARKAWATRHARNDNGSASALKAWATRRKAVAA